ncbi:unnamed protein product [Aphis gossypii]|uniref:Uncharacterized protein n=1 Tax=Aphis gossypii TaxID=80765 RepID=A0A9P0NLX0_APHGO|nr:unnamed protein product [Aphis gossypii]
MYNILRYPTPAHVTLLKWLSPKRFRQCICVCVIHDNNIILNPTYKYKYVQRRRRRSARERKRICKLPFFSYSNNKFYKYNDAYNLFSFLNTLVFLYCIFFHNHEIKCCSIRIRVFFLRTYIIPSFFLFFLF